MQKFKTLLVIPVFAALTLCSCGSTKVNKSKLNSSYSQTEEEKELEGRLYDAESLRKIAQSNTATKGQKFIKGFTTFGTKDVYYDFDSTDFYTKTLTGSLKKITADATMNPKTKMAGFSSSYYAAYYYFLMDEEARQSFIKAVNQYLSDFENKRLHSKEKNTFKKYGNIKAELNWGTVKKSIRFEGHGNAALGYEFQGKSPYFCISMFPVKNEKVIETVQETQDEPDSINLKYYFTKAQASALAALVSNETIDPILDAYSNMIIYETAAPKDDYTEGAAGEGDSY